VYSARATGTTVSLVFVDTLTGPEIALLDGEVTTLQSGFDPLPLLKADRIKKVITKTAELLAQGAVFDADDGNGDQTYAIMGEARFQICTVYGLYAINHAGANTFFPTTIPNIDGTLDIAYVDALAIEPLVDQVMATHLFFGDAGKALCVSINAAVSVAAVNAIADSRTWPMP